jgi:hypothetical protein
MTGGLPLFGTIGPRHTFAIWVILYPEACACLGGASRWAYADKSA